MSVRKLVALADTGASSSVLPYKLAKQLGLKIDVRGPPIFIRTANHQRVRCAGTTLLYTKHPDSSHWKMVQFLVVKNAQILILSNRDLKILRLLHERYPYFLGDKEEICTISTDRDDTTSDLGSTTNTHTVNTEPATNTHTLKTKSALTSLTAKCQTLSLETASGDSHTLRRH